MIGNFKLGINNQHLLWRTIYVKNKKCPSTTAVELKWTIIGDDCISFLRAQEGGILELFKMLNKQFHR